MSKNKLSKNIQNYMNDKVPKRYHKRWEKIFFLIEGYHGRTLTTEFQDIEDLKLVNYLAINMK